MADVRIQFDASEAEEYLREHGPRKVHNALRSAVRTTTTWADKELENRLAAETRIPVSVFRRFRVKKRHIGGSAASAFGGGGEIEKGYIWSGYRPIKARFAGKMSQDDSGAWAGPYYFGGAFMATMGSGLTAIFKRRGRKRLKIDEQKVELPQAEALAAGVAADAEQELLRRFRARFNGA